MTAAFYEYVLYVLTRMNRLEMVSSLGKKDSSRPAGGEVPASALNA
jgi:hypothetical protein